MALQFSSSLRQLRVITGPARSPTHTRRLPKLHLIEGHGPFAQTVLCRLIRQF